MDAQVYERTTTGHLLVGEPTPHPQYAVATHPGRLGIVDAAQVPVQDVALEYLDVSALALGEGDVHYAPDLPSRSHDPFGLRARSCQRLLAEYVLATN